MTDTPPLHDDLTDAAPSSKLVFVVLQQRGPSTRAELVEATALGDRTVWRALSDLRNRGVVAHIPDPTDPRRHLYSIT